MRFLAIIPVALLFVFPGAASAADWFQYNNREDFFSVNFPSEPEVEEFTYISEYDSELPAHRYTAKDGDSTYRMTVIDFHYSGRPPGRQGSEVRGSMAYAATALRHTGEVTYDAYGEIEVIPGHQLQITQPDGRRNFVQILLHDRRLYIAEGIVPGNVPPPALFQASIEVLDGEGKPIRYQDGDYSFPDNRPRAR